MIPSPFLHLANHLWQTTLFAGAAGLLTTGLKRNRAEIRYRIWFAASLKFLLPFSLLIDAGSHFGRHAAAASAPSAVSFAVRQVSVPFVSAVPSTNLFTSPISPTTWIPAILCAVWAIGFMTRIVSWWLKWRDMRIAVRTASPLPLPIDIPVMTSPAFRGPGVFGVTRPVLLLPHGIESRLLPREVNAIVAHELCHVRRRDNLTASIHMTIEAVFWFYPLVWWLGARLLEERERACDEEVLRMGNEPHVYAGAVLRVCELYLESSLRAVAGVAGGNLKGRIEAIMINRADVRLTLAKQAILAVAGAAALAIPILVGVVNAPPVRAQAAGSEPSGTARPHFEVASVKPSKTCGNGAGIPPPPPGPRAGGKSDRPVPVAGAGGPGAASPGRVNQCRTVEELIRMAYILFANGHSSGREVYGNAVPIEGGPAWVRSDLYRIAAKADGAASLPMINGPMMQTLLEERFRLKVHRETREGPAYALTVAKGGPRLRPFQEGSCIPMTVPPTMPRPGQIACANEIGKDGANATLDRRGMDLAALATFLFIVTGRPVVDRTGMAGRFDIHLEYTPDETTPGGVQMLAAAGGSGSDLAAGQAAVPIPTGGLSIFTAVQQQLGLKLQPARGPREYLVIDHIERAAEN